ncbi:flagellar basal body L-ring protein FlgH [Fretibacter rubidus]|uniref:flagellar basal body L-ring protein FlgH n=1 Tax=Fretibacter rubidus TaxID=570162 RepID=UPI00352A1C6B
MAYRNLIITTFVAFSLGAVQTATAENLFRDNSWVNMGADRKASQVGDILSVVVAETTEARNSARNSTDRSREIGGGINASGLSKFGNLSLGSNYAGRGEVRRSESLLTSISVSIDQVLPNGDYLVSGEQRMHVNGEWTIIGVRGRIREADITADNQILSNRIANAEINYNGEGFVSRGSRPGIMNWLFGVFGLV